MLHISKSLSILLILGAVAMMTMMYNSAEPFWRWSREKRKKMVRFGSRIGRSKNRDRSDAIETNITYFGQDANDDNGVGFAGVNLFRLGNGNMTFNGKRVYPVAVHHDDAAKWMYAVVELSGPKIKPGFLGYVVDICNRDDSDCKNKHSNGLNFLVDIHKTGFVASGNTNNGNDKTTGNVRRVGYISPKSIPDAYLAEGANTYIMCGCTGKCGDGEQRWNIRSKC